jgi:hypothetical protein
MTVLKNPHVLELARLILNPAIEGSKLGRERKSMHVAPVFVGRLRRTQ